jgi:hypothetical protein
MRNVVQDIIPPEKRSIRKISRSTEIRNSSHDDDVGASYPARDQSVRVHAGKRGPKKTRIWIVILVVSILALAAYHVFFSVASLTVTPVRAVVGVSHTFTAVKDGSPDSGSADIEYKTMRLENEDSQKVSSTGEEEVEEKASGNIVIFNNYSSKDQRLIKNTRFATPDGLEYRIPQSVIVPGIHESDGVDIPGSIEVTVFADQPGEEYNLGLTDFVIPGFEDDPEQYDSFYARSKTPMQGGFVGTRMKVSDIDKATALEEVHARLEIELRSSADSEIPRDYFELVDGALIEFESLQNTESDGSVTLNEKAVLTAIIINKGDLSRLIAEETISSYDDDQLVAIENFDELEFLWDFPDAENESTDGEIVFSVSGEASIVWQIDEESLKLSLAGKSRSEIPSVLLDYPGIADIRASFRPFWSSTFPEDPENIKVGQESAGPQERKLD